MKYICCLITIILALAASGQTGTPLNIPDLFTLSDAEKILGERAYRTESSESTNNNVTIYKYTYTALAADVKSAKTGAIYIMIEEYSEPVPAMETYSEIKKMNEKNGITTLDSLGDEAYFHTDKENFYFILARKGKRILRMKVNKITSVTSLDEFNKVARRITDAF